MSRAFEADGPIAPQAMLYPGLARQFSQLRTTEFLQAPDLHIFSRDPRRQLYSAKTTLGDRRGWQASHNALYGLLRANLAARALFASTAGLLWTA